MKKRFFGLLAAVLFVTLAGCGKDATAKSAPDSEQTQATEQSVAEEPATVGKIDTNVSSSRVEDDAPAAYNPEDYNSGSQDDTIQPEELDVIEDDPVIITDSSSKNAANVDWKDYYNGSTFNLDDYARALGYEVCFSETDDRDGLSYYNMIKGGIEYSVCNSDFTIVAYYADDENHWSGATLAIGPFGSLSEGVIIEAENQPARRASEQWIDDVASKLVFIAQQPSFFDFEDLPKVKGIYIASYEGACYSDINGTFYSDPTSKVLDVHEL